MTVGTYPESYKDRLTEMYPRALLLHETLLERGIDHQWTTWPGDHDGEYWVTHIPDYVRFYSHALTRR